MSVAASGYRLCDLKSKIFVFLLLQVCSSPFQNEFYTQSISIINEICSTWQTSESQKLVLSIESYKNSTRLKLQGFLSGLNGGVNTSGLSLYVLTVIGSSFLNTAAKFLCYTSSLSPSCSDVFTFHNWPHFFLYVFKLLVATTWVTAVAFKSRLKSIRKEKKTLFRETSTCYFCKHFMVAILDLSSDQK